MSDLHAQRSSAEASPKIHQQSDKKFQHQKHRNYQVVPRDYPREVHRYPHRNKSSTHVTSLQRTREGHFNEEKIQHRERYSDDFCNHNKKDNHFKYDDEELNISSFNEAESMNQSGESSSFKQIQNDTLNVHHHQQLDPSIFFTFQRYSSSQTKTKSRTQPNSRFIPGQYVRATHRLYIKPSVDVVDLLQHPDRFVDWNNVAKVDVLCHQTSDLLLCPICLDTVFTSPRITRCGHVFCLPCIMRTVDEKSKTNQSKPKCPVCGARLQISDLKSARFQIFNKPQIGDSVTMCLMTRDSLSSIASLGCPKAPLLSQFPMSSTQSFPFIPSFLVSSYPSSYFYRLVSLSPDDPFLQTDLCSLESSRLEAASFGDEQAIKCIDDCIQYVLLESDQRNDKGLKQDPINSLNSPSFNEAKLMTPSECHELYNYARFDINTTMRQLEGIPIDIDTDHQISKQMISNQNETQQNLYCFYQLVDGQFMFLDELCQRCLMRDIMKKKKENGIPYENPIQSSSHVICPIISNNKQLSNDQINQPSTFAYPTEIVQMLPSILNNIQILWMEEEFVDTLFRKRHPYLNFLPRGTSVYFLEVDLSTVVSPQTLNEFRPAFRRRKAKRDLEQKRKFKIEEQRSAQIEAVQKEQLQRRLLEHQQGSNPIDPITGLLVHTIITDQSLFPPLVDPITSALPSDGSMGMTERSPDWPIRISESRSETFPSLEMSVSSPSRPSLAFKAATGRTERLCTQKEFKKKTETPIKRVSHRPKNVLPPPSKNNLSLQSNQQHSGRGAPPWYRLSLADGEPFDDEAAEYLVTRRRFLDEQNEENSIQWEALDAALMKDSGQNQNDVDETKQGKKRNKKIFVSSASSYRL